MKKRNYSILTEGLTSFWQDKNEPKVRICHYSAGLSLTYYILNQSDYFLSYHDAFHNGAMATILLPDFFPVGMACPSFDI